MARVFISIGSNIDRERHIRAGIDALRARYGHVRLSPIYESVAVGFEGENFLNLVAEFETDQDVHEVAGALTEIETANGRVRSGPRFSARTLDLDLLLYDDLTLKDDRLELPRPEITENAFVLLPLADLAPELRHPLLGETFAELWGRYDQASQKLWQVEIGV